MKAPPDSDSPPGLEPPPRSVGELKQLLGVTQIARITTGEEAASESAEPLDVNPGTKDRLNWKPVFYAESVPESKDADRASGAKATPVRVAVTRAESEALAAAGAKRAR
jgi:hypothetical protein